MKNSARNSVCVRIPEHPGCPDYPKGVHGNKNPSCHSRGLNVGVRDAVEIQNPCWALLLCSDGAPALGGRVCLSWHCSLKHEACKNHFSDLGMLEKLQNPPFMALSCISTCWNSSKWHLLGVLNLGHAAAERFLFEGSTSPSLLPTLGVYLFFFFCIF